MGKNRKNRRNQDSDEDEPVQAEKISVPVPAAQNKKKNKNTPKFLPPDDDGSDDVKETWDASDDENTAPSDTTSSSQPIISNNNNRKKAKANAFALLGGDDSDTTEDVTSAMEKLDVAPEPAEATVVDPFAEEDSEDDKKKKKKGKKGKQQQQPAAQDGEEPALPGGTVKTKAQKAAEKKEREKKKREQAKAKKKEEDNEFAAALAEAGVVLADDYVQEEKKGKKKKKKKEAAPAVPVEPEEEVEPPMKEPAVTEPDPATVVSPEPVAGTTDLAPEGPDAEGDDGDQDEEGDTKKKRRKKKKPGEKQAKRPGGAHAKRLKEALDQIAAEKERLAREAEEAEREAERKEQERLEQLRLEEERKQRKKEKEKERKERRKKEGTWLSKAEREKRDRAQAALEAMRQQGIIVPGQSEGAPAEKPAGKVRYGGRQRKKKPQQPQKEEQIAEAMETDDKEGKSREEEERKATPTDSWELLDTPKTSVAEHWDSSGDEASPQEPKAEPEPVKDEVVESEEEEDEEDEEEEDESESESEEDDEEEEEEDESESDDELGPLERIEARKERAERTKDPSVLRAPILCVLGHVDTGKTTILDKFRHTNVQEGEAGGITQQIGATNVPIDNILKECAHLDMPDMKIPGMLIIDTPGHESFSNLRSRGSSLCDMAILVVDIMHGLEQQTIESLNLLKRRRTPFVIALNKIDRLYEWKTSPKTNVAEVLKSQKKITRDEFEDRSKQALMQIAEQGLNAKLFYENPDPRTYISVVPVSGWSGDGMADLLKLTCELSQKMLGPQLIFRDVLEAMVLEVKAIHGLGTTVDIILRNGQIKEGDNIVLSGIDGAFSTTIRAVLTPHPMKEMRVKNNYIQHKVVKAAQGIKICARDMDKTLAGMPVYVAKRPDEAQVLMDEANRALKEELKSIKLSPEGVYVQASTLGSLEALLEFLKESKIKYSGVSIGPVHKKDVMKASVMLQHDREFACLLAFDVKVERDAQETADSLGVRIFTADIIYHLFDQFVAYKDELKSRRKEENRHNAVFPCRLRVIPTCIFNTRDPIVLGVTVINGVLKPGTPLCVPSKEFVFIGVVTSLEMNNRALDVAHTGQDVCIKIENVGGDAPKLYGRHFDENDVLVSKITRDSIDCLKEYFRDDMSKGDWKLIVELKKLFNIL